MKVGDTVQSETTGICGVIVRIDGDMVTAEMKHGKEPFVTMNEKRWILLK